MNNIRRIAYRMSLLITLVVALSVASSRTHAQFQAEDTGTCGGVTVTLPFNDVMNSQFFCQIAEAYFSGLTNGTSATTYDPNGTVSREQMAAFVTRTQDSALRRGSPRAALGQWATPSSIPANALTTVGATPISVQSDGADLWVTNDISGTVSRVRASDGRLLDTYTGMTNPQHLLVARGHIYVTGLLEGNPGILYSIDPKLTSATPGAVTTLTNNLGVDPTGLTTDGTYIWTANFIGSTISKVNPDTGTVQTLTPLQNASGPIGILYDGANIWVTNQSAGTLVMLNSTGNLTLQTINVGSGPRFLGFDGTNIWVPNKTSSSVTVVRVKDSSGNPASAPFVVATLTGNGLNQPDTATFDGQRILVTNTAGQSISLWRAADFSPITWAFAPTGNFPSGACSDGINFWVVLQAGGSISSPGSLARF